MLQIANNIKKIRKLQKLTQEKFALQMNVTVAMQKSYESGKAKPDLVYMENLGTITFISIKELLEKDLKIDYIEKRMKMRPAHLIATPTGVITNLIDVNKWKGEYPDDSPNNESHKLEEHDHDSTYNNTNNPCYQFEIEIDFLKRRIDDLEVIIKTKDEQLNDKSEIIVLQRSMLNYQAQSKASG